MTEEDVTALVAALSSDLATIGAGVIALSLTVAVGLWIRRVLGY